MQDRDHIQDRETAEARPDAYEPPEATIVPVDLQPRVGGCNFSTIQVCGLTEM